MLLCSETRNQAAYAEHPFGFSYLSSKPFAEIEFKKTRI